MTTLHYYECPSWVCKYCDYTFQERGFCPDCKHPLTKCAFKTEDYENGMVCPDCKNGFKLQVRNKEIYKKCVESLEHDKIPVRYIEEKKTVEPIKENNIWDRLKNIK